MADINDVYAWMTSDGTTVNLALTVSPFDNGNRAFGPSVQYVFHVTSRPGFAMAGIESKVICTFEDNTNGQCWVVSPQNATLDYVSGDFTGASGKASEGGKLRVFAGRRSDPFFFNFGGLKNAIGAAVTACGGGTPAACPGMIPTDGAGCLQINGTTAGGLRAMVATAPTAPLSMTNPCPPNQIDCFAGYNVMAIVIQVDRTLLLNGTDNLVTVWGSTHAGS